MDDRRQVQDRRHGRRRGKHRCSRRGETECRRSLSLSFARREGQGRNRVFTIEDLDGFVDATASSSVTTSHGGSGLTIAQQLSTAAHEFCGHLSKSACGKHEREV